MSLKLFAIYAVLCMWTCLVMSTSIAGVMAADDNRLDNAFTKSHRPGDGEPYSSTADADDMFDSKIDI
jgi:hypothetical protein